ncbi:unnamed protein product [Coffea canephora]|uniref:Ribosomal protein L19 n=1 Tax=Coffea canephora TaxID=49390 RepID=A0A068UYN3_COFCA|nr:unnamed protein product [Coffea canephora]
MQAIHGKIRLIGRLTINNFKNVDLKRAVWDSAVTSSSTHLGSNPLWLQLKEFGTETGFLMSFKNNGMWKGEKSWTGPAPCLSQLVRLVPTNRCFSTIGNSVESAPQDASILDKEAVEEVKSKRGIPEIKPGYMVQLKVEVPENKRRVSVIKGIVIARRNSGISTTFRLRRLVAGVGVESLYQLYSPNIKEIKVLDKKKVRRAKLYYLRDKMNALKK